MPRCTDANRAAAQTARTEQAIEFSNRHNEGWKRAAQEYDASNGRDFGYPVPFDVGTPEYEGYRDFVIAVEESDDYCDMGEVL